MQTIPAIVFKSVVTAAIMLLYYILVLRNKKLHTFNRFYLLATVCVSIIVPFLHFDWYTVKSIPSATTNTVLQVLSGSSDEETYVHIKENSINVLLVLEGIYLLVSGILLTLAVYKTVQVFKIKRSHKVTQKEGYNLVQTDLPKAPFSFMSSIFWKSDIAIDSETGKQILRHELVHIRQRHTLDKLLMELVLAVCWINPFFWFIRKELSMVHEFLADEHSVEGNDTSALAQMLLTSHYPNYRSQIVNTFFYSPIKRRIMMLKETNNIRYMFLRRAMVLPLLLVPLFLFSFTLHKNAPAVKANKNVILILDAGHGGKDKGAVTSFGLQEKDLTLSICKKIAALSNEYGVNVVLTRDGDNYPSLFERVAMANKVTDGVFVSIHVNKSNYADMPVDGVEVAVATQNPEYEKSKKLATEVAGHLYTPSSKPAPRLTERKLFVLRDNHHPAILIECGNIDNANDMAVLQADKTLEAFCRNILSGVVAFSNNN